MQTYAAVDLHSNNGVLTIIDETDRVLKQRKLSTALMHRRTLLIRPCTLGGHSGASYPQAEPRALPTAAS